MNIIRNQLISLVASILQNITYLFHYYLFLKNCNKKVHYTHDLTQYKNKISTIFAKILQKEE